MYANATAFKAATEIPLRDDESRSMRTLVPVASAAPRAGSFTLSVTCARETGAGDRIQNSATARAGTTFGALPPSGVVPWTLGIGRGAGGERGWNSGVAASF